MPDRPNPEGVVYNLPSRFRFVLFAAVELLDVVCRERASATDAISASAPFDWKSAEERVHRQLEIASEYYRVVEREMAISGGAVQELLQLADDAKTALTFGQVWNREWPKDMPQTEAREFERIEAGLAPIAHEKRKALRRDMDAQVRLAATKITPRLQEGAENAPGFVFDFVCELLWVGGHPQLLEHERRALERWSEAPVDEDSLTIRWSQRKIRELLMASQSPPSLEFGTGRAAAASLPSTDHSPDFVSVRWGRELLIFNTRQAACVCVMWNEWKRGTPFLSQAFILENAYDTYKAETGLDLEEVRSLEKSPRLRDVFKVGSKAVHKAWGLMIVKQGRDVFGLTLPDAKDSPEIPT